MSKKTVLFNGRNINGIMDDAKKENLLHDPVVIVRENDRLDPPEGMEAVTSNNFNPNYETEYIVIGNGGTTTQLVPILHKLFTNPNYSYTIVDLQRDGTTVLVKR